MWPYVLYFLIGGTVVSLVAYIGARGDGMAAAFVASIPILFITNMILLYHNGGVSAGITYAKGALMYTPLFVGCVLLTMVLLPRLSMPWPVFAGISIYSLAMAFARPASRRQVVGQETRVELSGHTGPSLASYREGGDEEQNA